MSLYCLNFLYSTLQGIFVLSVQFGAVHFMGDKSNFMFNHSEINDVVYKGYTNPERDKFINFHEEQEKAEKEE